MSQTQEIYVRLLLGIYEHIALGILGIQDVSSVTEIARNWKWSLGIVCFLVCVVSPLIFMIFQHV